MPAGRPPLDNPYTLSDQEAAFYRQKATEGIYPTDLAVICLRNEEERFSEIAKTVKRNRAVRSQPNPVLRVEKVPPKVQPAPEMPRIRLSYLDCMARKAL